MCKIFSKKGAEFTNAVLIKLQHHRKRRAKREENMDKYIKANPHMGPMVGNDTGIYDGFGRLIPSVEYGNLGDLGGMG